ncbi:MAG TPA: penicillin-binding protein 2 [Thermosulfurimonas dismutans]|uniref:Penicillin-binding protein 2 n=1 Tax=Thermosulfurimonas dismutans TaxID=999894 RepID=A0A7C3CTF6_9BACT|nr:penicillin-binding protein 2 [Thermosulfurimonas dismutans]
MVSKDIEELYEKRLIFWGYGFLFLFFIVLVKLFYLQILRHSYFMRLAVKRTFSRVLIPAPRGRIFDRRGVLLAGDRPTFNLYLDPYYLKGHEDQVLRVLARILGEKLSVLKTRYLLKKRQSYGEVLLRQGLDWATVARIEARSYYLPGVRVEARPARFYPFGPAFFYPLGYVSRVSRRDLRVLQDKGYGPEDFVGRRGLEKAYEEVLRGQKGMREVERDAFGRIVRIIREVPPRPGRDLFLTLDAYWQREIYRLLKGRSGAVVVMDPRNGEVLSLVSAPSPDPQEFVRGFTHRAWEELNRNPYKPLLNKALQAYQPGSTFKPVTLLAALEAGVVTPAEEIYCPGYYRLGRQIFRCWRRWGHGKVSLVQALAQSCDVYFYTLGTRLDIDYLAHFARQCGFGRLSGLGIPGEKPGLVPDRTWKRRAQGKRWQKGETLLVAIGQGPLEVNLMQLVKFYAALGNGGTLWKPYVVEEIADPSGKEVQASRPRKEGELPVKGIHLRWVKEGLIEAVNGKHGTGRAARLKGIVVAGKTGTAQVVRRKKEHETKEEIPYQERDHAWFVAFAPAEDPQVVVGVFVEHGGHGGEVAAPLAGKILRMYFGEGKP